MLVGTVCLPEMFHPQILCWIYEPGTRLWHRLFPEVVLVRKVSSRHHTISMILSKSYRWLVVKANIDFMEFTFHSGNMMLRMISVCFNMHNGSYHHVLSRLLLAGLCLMCTQPCLGVRLNLYKQDPKLTAVPVGLPTDITGLVLRGNEISEIGANIFTRLSSVMIIDLTYNRIAHIDDHAFLPCTALSDLRLDYNRLTSMPSTLGPNSPYMSSLHILAKPFLCYRQFLFQTV